MKLDNGMQVLLIHDPNMGYAARHTKKPANEWVSGHQHRQVLLEDDEEYSYTTAAAIAVAVGSFSDPEELQGAAHFLEHAVFLGCAAYPAEAGLDAFLTRNAGGSNAWTEPEYTCFHLDVDADALPGALGRLAALLRAPLLRRAALAREVLAVDSEFTGTLQSNTARAMQLLSATAAPGHPLRKFSWGNKRSLWDRPEATGVDVQAVLRAHFEKYYGAQNLRAAVLSDRSLDELQALVTAHFGDIARAPLDAPEFGSAGPPFSGNMLYIMPAVGHCHQLTVTWQWPSQRGLYAKKADAYFAHLLCHGGDGSLLSALKRRGWATAVTAGCDEDGMLASSACWLFQVTISLTDAGAAACVADAPAIALRPLDLLFACLGLIAANGINDTIWGELAALADIDFQYQEPADDVDEWVSDLAPALLEHAPQHVLVGPYLYGDFDAAHLHALLAGMVPSAAGTLRVDLLTAGYGDAAAALAGLGVCEVAREPWFGFDYLSMPIPVELIQRWAAAVGSEPLHAARASACDDGVGACDAQASGTDEVLPGELRLPAPNPFVPGCFALVAPATAAQKPAPPTLLVDGPGLRVWHRTSVYNTPAVQVRMRLSSREFYASPQAAAATLLLGALWSGAIAPLCSQAFVAGIDCQSTAHHATRFGFEISVSGFAEPVPRFVEALFDKLRQTMDSVPEGAFVQAAQATLRTLEGRTPPSEDEELDLRAILALERFLVGDAATGATLLAALAATDASALRAFARRACTDLHLEALVIGNITQGPAQRLAEGARSALFGGGTLAAAERPAAGVARLRDGMTYVMREPSAHGDINSVYGAYYQVGVRTPRSVALTDLAVELLSEPLYHQLRTKEQLGYGVEVAVMERCGVLGIVITVATKRELAAVDDRVEAFLSSFERRLSRLSSGAFADYKENVAAERVLLCHSLVDEADLAWEAVARGECDYSMLVHERHTAMALTLKDMRTWYARHLSPSSRTRRKLRVDCLGDSGDSKEQAAVLEDPLAARKHHRVQPHVIDIVDLDLVKSTLETFPMMRSTSNQHVNKVR